MFTIEAPDVRGHIPFYSGLKEIQKMINYISQKTSVPEAK